MADAAGETIDNVGMAITNGTRGDIAAAFDAIDPELHAKLARPPRLARRLAGSDQRARAQRQLLSRRSSTTGRRPPAMAQLGYSLETKLVRYSPRRALRPPLINSAIATVPLI